MLCTFGLFSNPEVTRNVFAQNPLAEPTLRLQHDYYVSFVAWNHDETRIVTYEDSSFSFHIWDAKTGEKLVSERALFIEPDPSKTFLLVGYNARTISLWDIKNHKKLFDFVHPSATRFRAKWSPDSQYILTNTATTAYVWAANTGKEVGEFGAEDADETFWGAFWSPDGMKIIASSFVAQNGEEVKKIGIRDFDVSRPTIGSTFLSFVDPEPAEISEHYIVEGNRFLIFTESGFLRIWDIEPTSPSAGKIVATIQYSTTTSLANVGPLFPNWSVSNDHTRLLTWGDEDLTAHLWDIDSGSPTLGQEIASFSCDLYPPWPHWNPQGTILALACGNEASADIFLWGTDPNSADFGKQLMSITIETVISMSFASIKISWDPLGEKLAYVYLSGDDPTIIISDLTQDKVTAFNAFGDITDYFWSPNSRYFISTGFRVGHYVTNFWDVVAGKHLFAYDIAATTIVWNADETSVAISSTEENNVYVWNLEE